MILILEIAAGACLGLLAYRYRELVLPVGAILCGIAAVVYSHTIIFAFLDSYFGPFVLMPLLIVVIVGLIISFAAAGVRSLRDRKK